MKYYDKIFYEDIQKFVEPIVFVDELRSDVTNETCNYIEDAINDYKNKIEELEDRVEELENILTDNDIEY